MEESSPVCDARPLKVLSELRHSEGNVWSGRDREIVEGSDCSTIADIEIVESRHFFI
jgi:hypothetical protein